MSLNVSFQGLGLRLLQLPTEDMLPKPISTEYLMKVRPSLISVLGKEPIVGPFELLLGGCNEYTIILLNSMGLLPMTETAFCQIYGSYGYGVTRGCFDIEDGIQYYNDGWIGSNRYLEWIDKTKGDFRVINVNKHRRPRYVNTQGVACDGLTEESTTETTPCFVSEFIYEHVANTYTSWCEVLIDVAISTEFVTDVTTLEFHPSATYHPLNDDMPIYAPMQCIQRVNTYDTIAGKRVSIDDESKYTLDMSTLIKDDVEVINKLCVFKIFSKDTPLLLRCESHHGSHHVMDTYHEDELSVIVKNPHIDHSVRLRLRHIGLCNGIEWFVSTDWVPNAISDETSFTGFKVSDDSVTFYRTLNALICEDTSLEEVEKLCSKTVLSFQQLFGEEPYVDNSDYTQKVFC